MICSTCQKETFSRKGYHQNCFRPNPGETVTGRRPNTTPSLWTVVRLEEDGWTGNYVPRVVAVCKLFGNQHEDAPTMRFKARALRPATQEEIAQWVTKRIRGETTWDKPPFYVDQLGIPRLDLGT